MFLYIKTISKDQETIQLSIPINANVFSLMKQFRAEDALIVVMLREAFILTDPEAGRTRTKKREQRQTDLANPVENYDNLSINSYMGYLVDNFNHSLD